MGLTFNTYILMHMLYFKSGNWNIQSPYLDLMRHLWYMCHTENLSWRIYMKKGRLHPQTMHAICICCLLSFDCTHLYPYASGIFHWQWNPHTSKPPPVKQLWKISVDTPHATLLRITCESDITNINSNSIKDNEILHINCLASVETGRILCIERSMGKKRSFC